MTSKHRKPDKWHLEQVSIGVYFEITRRCNLSCRYCYVEGLNTGPDLLDTTQINGIIREISDAGGAFLTISGGEPLKRKDIFKILDLACPMLPVAIITNGTLITPGIASKLSSYDSLHIDVSIDGPESRFHDPNRGEGNFRRTMTGIKNLLKAGMRQHISLCATLASHNIESVEDMAQMTAGLGIPSFVITPAARQGKSEKIWDSLKPPAEQLVKMFSRVFELEREYGDKLRISGSMKSALNKSFISDLKIVRCPVGQRVAIDYSGEVYPCSMMMFPEFSTGNILNQSFESIISGDLMKKYKECALGRKDNIKKCAGCQWKNYCAGGCMARAYTELGDLNKPDPDCDVIEYLLSDLAGNEK